MSAHQPYKAGWRAFRLSMRSDTDRSTPSHNRRERLLSQMRARSRCARRVEASRNQRRTSALPTRARPVLPVVGGARATGRRHRPMRSMPKSRVGLSRDHVPFALVRRLPMSPLEEVERLVRVPPLERMEKCRAAPTRRQAEALALDQPVRAIGLRDARNSGRGAEAAKGETSALEIAL